MNQSSKLLLFTAQTMAEKLRSGLGKSGTFFLIWIVFIQKCKSYYTIDDKHGLLSTVNKLLPSKNIPMKKLKKFRYTTLLSTTELSILPHNPQKYTSHIYDKDFQLWGYKISIQNVCKINLIQQTKSSEKLMVWAKHQKIYTKFSTSFFFRWCENCENLVMHLDGL